eukprot:s6144_g3.t1
MLCCKASGQKRGTPVPVKTEDETSTKAPSSTTAGASSVRGDPKLRVKRELVKAEQEDDDAGEADASMRSSYKRRKEKEAKTAKQDDRSVPWSYENGKRMSGSLCCVSAVEQGTGKMWEPGIQLYLSKEEPKYNAVVDACAMAYSKLDPSVLPKYYPGESVFSSQERGHNMGRFGLQVSEVKISHLVKFSHMGYMGLVRILSSKVGSESSIELAFISEAQFLSLTGCTPKALECDVHERQAEDGQSIITGVYVSYGDVVDVPMQQILSWRKVKFFARTVTSAQEAHLTPERQLRRQQAVPLMQLIESQRWRPGCIDKQGGEAPFLAKVPMLGGLMSKGQRQLEKKEEALQKKLLLARQAEEEEKEEKDDDRSADSVDASSSQVEEARTKEAKPKKKKPSKSKVAQGARSDRSKKGKAADTEQDGTERTDKAGSGGQELLSDEQIEEKMSHDPELMKAPIWSRGNGQ